MRNITFTLLLFPFIFFSQIPEYYSTVDFSLSGDDLKDQLTLLIDQTHIVDLEYTPGVWDVLKQSDLNPEDEDTVLLIYGYNDTDSKLQNDRSRDVNLSCHTSGCIGLWNREHVFPKSLGTPNLGTEFAGADAHSLRPADSQMNSSRGNKVFEDGSGNATITSNGNFYPGDEWKGDVARMMMYMYVRYPSQCQATAVGIGATSYSDFGDMPDIFLEWNSEDPVSEFEITRNNIVAAAQGNRNPFIDNPYIATRLWNGPEAEDTWNVLDINIQEELTTFIYPTVTRDCVTIHNYVEQDQLLSIYTVTGTQVTAQIDNNQVCLEDLASGMYFISLQSVSNQQTFKVLKR
ncbi:endonuclease [uncultured Planktosalinus sp.]|uniref:endonuclease n=1 Tax=uncultured Planktosalinus sp. TaxID=1810935 RepID=UPI0030DD2CB6